MFNLAVIHEAIALLNGHSTDTNWFQPLWDYTLCFTDHRIKFVPHDETKKTSSTHGSVFVYLGKNELRFAEVFRQFGRIVREWNPYE